MGIAKRSSARNRNVAASLRAQGGGMLDERRRAVATARLEALENDNAAAEAEAEQYAGDGDSEDYAVDPADLAEGPCFPGRRRGIKKPGKRHTRGARERSRGPKSFAVMLEESNIDLEEGPNYLTAAAGPSRWSAPRKFCSVCGFESKYTCTQCGSRFCCLKCKETHNETRCLKFVVL